MYIRQGKTKLDAVEKSEDVWDFEVRNLFYRTSRQMEDVFRGGFVTKDKEYRPEFLDDIFTEEVFKEAMDNTLKVARNIENIKLDSTVKLPKLYKDSESILRDKVNTGFRSLGLNKKPNKQEYVDRLRYEFSVITKLGWSDYFLVMEKIIDMAKKEFYDEVGEWAIGYGRGCFHPSTQVVMGDGTLRFIGDIKAGEKVISDDGSIREVDAALEYEVDEILLEVEVDDGRLVKCTEDHEWKVVRNGKEVWVQAKDLVDGDEIVEVT
jgi:hypothetical protein